nr:hypothetical protein [Tanacetum cinerariifolium]
MSTSKTYQQSFVDADSETRPPMIERRIYRGNALLHYDAKIEVMNLILLSILNDIYSSVDACTSAKDTWKRVERLMMGTIQNKVDRETRFTNEIDQFVAEPGEALVTVYNRFAQLMNDLERNEMHFLIVTINIRFLNSLQPEWLKYVTQVHLAKRLTVDTFDDLFDYLQQFEKLVNTSRAKKLEKSHDPLALVAHTGSSSENTSSYYVTHLTSVVDYNDENSGNTGRKNRRAYDQEEVVERPNETGNVQRTLWNSSSGNTLIVQCYNCSGKEHYARNSKYFMEQITKQSIFTTSSVKAEYIAAYDAFKEAVWVRRFIFGLRVVPTIEEPIHMYCDNTRAITIANESRITKSARHFCAKVHYLCEVIEYGDIKLEKVHTDDNLADPFTKALAFPKHSEHTRNIKMLPASSLM